MLVIRITTLIQCELDQANWSAVLQPELHLLKIAGYSEQHGGCLYGARKLRRIEHRSPACREHVLRIRSRQPGDARQQVVGKALSNGWTISGITTWQAGGNLQANSTPQNLGLTIQNTTLNHTIGSSTYFGTPVQTVLPILTCSPTSGLKSNQKINLDCFSAPQLGSQGIRQAPYLSGSSYFDTDAGIYKTFHINERNSIQFRAQGFNWLNHPLPGFSGQRPDHDQTADPPTIAPFTPQVSNSNRGITDTKFGATRSYSLRSSTTSSPLHLCPCPALQDEPLQESDMGEETVEFSSFVRRCFPISDLAIFPVRRRYARFMMICDQEQAEKN